MACKLNPIDLTYSPVFKSSHDLYNSVQSPRNLIIVDVRGSQAYKAHSVRTAINVDWNSSPGCEKDGLKRLKYYSGAGRKFTLRKYFKLFLYDDCDFSVCSEEKWSESPAWKLVEALKLEGECKVPIYLLKEGFDSFRSKYPYLVHGHPDMIPHILPTEILEGKLYLGSAAEGKNSAIHGILKIGAVVNCTLDHEFTIKGAGNQFRVPVNDICRENIHKYFRGAMEFMKSHINEGRSILVHCMRGMSRSATIVILYLVQECDMSLKQAYDFVKEKRPSINPNPNFLKQAGELELKLRGVTTIRFKQKGAITNSTVYEWWVGEEWVPRVVITKPT